MHTIKAIVTATVLVLGLSVPASAQNEPSGQGLLVVAKMTGACGILNSMIQFQTSTQMAGGEEFVARFWNVEAARLGLTVQQLSDQCDESIGAYDRIWKALESGQ
ncbi:hypothetical protein QAA18_07445 [Luteimonas sp. 8-5]|uniref:hypothetical protein n=1 Tax=Luteimonas sp. 8-5 TaxID=3039387 RepID=UPI0024371AAE|nr:hypothetical protein [Luteimonas sp. 8-5]MDG6348577.1 hypothetical protein [Luteimonas sp. 8-5]